MSTATEPTAKEAVLSEHEELEELRDWKAEVEAARQAVKVAESEWDDSKAMTASLKKIYEGKVVALCNIIDQSNEELPLFDQQPAAWRKVPIVEALPELTEAQAGKLMEAGITTVGQFEDVRGGKGLKSLPGVGQATADKWEEQILAWLSEHRDKQVLEDAAQGQQPIEPPALAVHNGNGESEDEPRRMDQ